MAKTKSKKNPYKWDDGSYHSIPAATHRQNVQAKGYGINLDNPVATPLTNRGAFGMAEAAANRVYGPQISAAENIQSSLPAWFQNYQNTAGAAATAAQQYAQPMINAAQATANNTAQVAPGLDPSSPQYGKEQQAAQGRQAIAQLGASSLGAVATANQGYFNQLQATAARDQPLAQAYYGREIGRLKGERGQGVVDEYGRLRTGEQNADIARGTLTLNTAKAADVNPITGKPNPKPPEDRITSGAFAGETDSSIAAMTPTQRQAKIDDYAKTKGTSGNKINQYGIRESQWATWSTAHRQRVIRQFKGGGKTSDKKKGAIEKATGKGRVEIENIATAWHGYVGKTVEDRDKAPDPVTGQYPRRPITPSDIKRILGKKYDAGAIHVALLVDGGKPLDQAAIAYLHSRDPNFRIPREWLRGKKKSSGKSDPKPTSGQQGGLGGK